MEHIDTDDWIEEIGSFITSFALLEQYVYRVIEILPQDKLTKYAKERRDFNERARRKNNSN